MRMPAVSAIAAQWLTPDHLLEDHEVIAAVGVPAHADDVVAQGDGEVEHGSVFVVAFEAD